MGRGSKHSVLGIHCRQRESDIPERGPDSAVKDALVACMRQIPIYPACCAAFINNAFGITHAVAQHVVNTAQEPKGRNTCQEVHAQGRLVRADQAKPRHNRMSERALCHHMPIDVQSVPTSNASQGVESGVSGCPAHLVQTLPAQ